MRIRPFLIPLLTLQVIIASSCSQKDIEWKGTVEEKDGVVIVRNSKDPMYGSEIFQLEEELFSSLPIVIKGHRMYDV
jgi:hypothetical protein